MLYVIRNKVTGSYLTPTGWGSLLGAKLMTGKARYSPPWPVHGEFVSLVGLLVGK